MSLTDIFGCKYLENCWRQWIGYNWPPIGPSLACGESNGVVINNVTWPWKVDIVTPICAGPSLGLPNGLWWPCAIPSLSLFPFSPPLSSYLSSSLPLPCSFPPLLPLTSFAVLPSNLTPHSSLSPSLLLCPFFSPLPLPCHPHPFPLPLPLPIHPSLPVPSSHNLPSSSTLPRRPP